LTSEAPGHSTLRDRLRGASPALKFVLLVGVMSFFADFTYEGSRSVIGPYLGTLGAGALAISVISGLGEFLGYGLRLFSGRSADRTGRYWPITISGYVVQMAAVPLLALAGNWEVAALLIIAERIGKATRNPARDAMLSHAAKEMGYGWASACTRRSTSSVRCSGRCWSHSCWRSATTTTSSRSRRSRSLPSSR
jgi:MFS family permease